MKRKSILKALLVIVLFFGIGLLLDKGAVKVQAYYWEYISDLKQSGIAKNSVTVSWTAVKDAAKYRVEFKEYSAQSSVAYRVAGTTTATSYKIGGLKSGRKYYVRVTPISASGEDGGEDDIYGAVTAPDKIAKFKQHSWWYYIKEFRVSWDELDGVSGYQIEIYDGKNKKVKSANLTDYATYYSHEKKVSNSQIYKVKLRAFTTFNGKKHYSKWQETLCFPQPEVKSVKVSSGKLNLKWGKLKGMTGFDIYVSTKRDSGYKKVKSVGKNATSTTISKFNKKSFNSKKTYYVYVVSKKKVGKTTYNSGSTFEWNSRY